MKSKGYRDFLASALTINLVLQVITFMGFFMPRVIDSLSWGMSLLAVNIVLFLVLVVDND
jgi:hypothetical protein